MTGLPPLVTLAVKVTSSPATDGFGADVTAVAVVSAVATSLNTVRHQPPAIVPTSTPSSSTTNRLHTPLGSVLLNVANVVAPDGAGAGAGHESVAAPRFVGRYVPVTSGVPAAGALSTNVRFAPVTSTRPPASLSKVTLAPVGPTSRMSKSIGVVWPTPASWTVTSPATGSAPLTVIVDGYGAAMPDVPVAGTVIGLVLQNPPTARATAKSPGSSAVDGAQPAEATVCKLAAIASAPPRL